MLGKTTALKLNANTHDGNNASNVKTMFEN